jgi:YVTN family beta-propeller protein
LWKTLTYVPVLQRDAFDVSAAQQADVVVGPQADGSVVVANSQVIRAAGRQISFLGSPSAIAIRPSNHMTAAVVNGVSIRESAIVIIDLQKGEVLQQLEPFAGAQASVNGLIYSADGKNLYASDNANSGSVDAYKVAPDGTITFVGSAILPNDPNLPTVPAGLALSADGKSIYVDLNGLNTLGVIDVATMKLSSQIPVGNAPYGVVVADETEWVTDQGGIVPTKDDPVNQSAGTNILVNPETGAASTGSVSAVDLKSGSVKYTIVWDSIRAASFCTITSCS